MFDSTTYSTVSIFENKMNLFLLFRFDSIASSIVSISEKKKKCLCFYYLDLLEKFIQR